MTFGRLDYFKKSLHLPNHRDPSKRSARTSVLSTKIVLFILLGKANRVIDCVCQAALLCQTTEGSMILKFLTILFKMNSLLNQHGYYEDSVNCLKFAFEIRKAMLSDSFVVTETCYVSQELMSKTDNMTASHLKQALRICHQE